ncbi:MAG: hypothetical protein FWG51_01105, partial [Firmicutes bacterium]|nr:hypothetical protein [Bacillota bacterium]
MKRFLVLILVIFLVAASLISISTAFAAEPEFIEILKEKQTLQNDRIKVSANFVLPEKFDSLHINLNIVKFCKTLKTDTLNVKVEDENSLLVLSFSYTQRIFVNHPILVAALGYFKNGEEIFSEKRDLTDVPDIRIEIKNFEGLQIQINEQELTIDNFEE